MMQATATTELTPALARFERGDYKGARGALRALLAATPEPAVQTAARDLLSRMSPDPWAIGVGLGALALLLAVCVLYVL